MKKRVFIVNSARYFDRVNGNSYNSAKIIDCQNDNVIELGYQYGSDDTSRARDEILKILKVDHIDYKKIQVYYFFAGYIGQRKVKNFNY